MEFWDNIIHTALLGTDKRQLRLQDVNEDLAAAFTSINESGDKEEQYLNMAAVAFNYRKCGNQPLKKNVLQTVAEAETKVYCSAATVGVLNDIISIESQSLFGLWIKECVGANQIIQPEYIPLLFDLGMKYKWLQQEILTVSGNRGKWLLPFNEAWKFDTTVADESLWQTGTVEQRRCFLKELRKTAPAKAMALLQQTWPLENANTKTELLKQLKVNIGDEDVAWLQQLLSEKGQKVKDETLVLLKQIPISNIVQLYWSILKQSISIRKEKGFLGLVSKDVIEIKLADIEDEAIFKTGIEKISSEKGVVENDFIIYQLIAAVPPGLLKTHYQLSYSEIIERFNKSAETKYFVSAFGIAANTFKDVEMLRAVLAVSADQFYPEALLLLPLAESEQYAREFLGSQQSADAVLHYLVTYGKQQWSLQITIDIFKHTAKNNYTYNRLFYKHNILLFAADVLPELPQFAPDEVYAKEAWVKSSGFIAQLINLRTQTLKAF